MAEKSTPKFRLPVKKCIKIVVPKEQFDRRSFRWTPLANGGAILIGCPQGQWDNRIRRCKVGTRAHEIVIPPKPSGRCKDRSYTRKA